jgi:hypothetical protein
MIPLKVPVPVVTSTVLVPATAMLSALVGLIPLAKASVVVFDIVSVPVPRPAFDPRAIVPADSVVPVL